MLNRLLTWWGDPSHGFDEMYVWERWAVNALSLTLLLIFTGIGLVWAGVENPLSEALFEFFIDPIRGESVGDSGYNTVNTMTYALVLGLFVIALSAWLRGLGIDPSDASVLALLPFITWAAFGEVVEDAEMFGPDLAPYFVSPGIHFQAAFWVILAGAVGLSLDRIKLPEEPQQSHVEALASILILTQFIFYGPSISEKVGDDFALWPMLLGAVVAIAFACTSKTSTSAFSNVQRMVYLVGIGGSLVFLGALVSHAIHSPPPTDRLWPLMVVIALPLLLCYSMYSYGREAAEELAGHGLVAGILPPGWTEERYMESESPEKDMIESLRLRASTAQPLIFLAVAGQLMDGVATWIGIDFFGYSEKHVFSSGIIDLLDTALTFAIVKLGLGALIWYFFAIANFEHRQQHLRLLIGVAMLVVGMAPGLRDVGRLTLGV
ncbi:MAG: hypothetical protein CMA54_02010 [Euryarchaeota archaeon]|nr:hypothetical protein [Euryarchaeota archaeon]